VPSGRDAAKPDPVTAGASVAPISGAALDVTAVEPLPAESPLWTAPELVLTPHAAGGRRRPVSADVAVLRAES
jgi:phosphoglycerate dehydrogenase-like enzyme